MGLGARYQLFKNVSRGGGGNGGDDPRVGRSGTTTVNGSTSADYGNNIEHGGGGGGGGRFNADQHLAREWGPMSAAELAEEDRQRREAEAEARRARETPAEVRLCCDCAVFVLRLLWSRRSGRVCACVMRWMSAALVLHRWS